VGSSSTVAPAKDLTQERLKFFRWLRELLGSRRLLRVLKAAWLYGTVGAASAFAALSSARLLRYLWPAVPKSHPGTAAWRMLRDNTGVVPPEDFEARFIGRKGLEDEGPWDFIVVGSGSAGCVLASKLAQHPNVRVLLLEAGGEAQNSNAVAKPVRCHELWRSEVDWGYRSAPQEHLVPPGRSVNCERGLTLGGSSSINYCMWVHGQKQDFKRWAEQWGCGDDWRYERVAPHFAALERMTSATFADQESASLHRGMEGSIQPGVAYPPVPEVNDFIEACESIGIPRSQDYNDWVQTGSGYTQFNVQGAAGTRADAFNAFVEPTLRSRKNLRVVSEVFVRRLLFDEAKRCTAVEVELNDGTVVALRASREVILSAGAINSPAILMHSGVGDSQELKDVGITPLLHAPAVGKNLMDHPMTSIVCFTKEPWDGLRHGTSGLSGVAFTQSPIDKAIAEEEGYERGPDLELVPTARISPNVGNRFLAELVNTVLTGVLGADMYSRFPTLWRAVNGISRKLGGMSWARDQMNRILLIGAILNHPESRGFVRLSSADPHAAPVIDPKWLSDQRDVEKLKWSVYRIRDLLRHPKLFERLENVSFPLPARDQPLSMLLDDNVTDEQVELHVRAGMGTTWHYSCTVRMGPKGDETSPCDPRLRVKGLQGVRVADASIMPVVNSANTNAMSMVIGSMAADFIAEDHGLEPRAGSGVSGVEPLLSRL